MSLFSSPTGGRDPLLHLIGHPLPACIDSPCTSASPNASTGADAGAGAAREEGPPASTVDLFLLSLEKPILLFLFPGVGRGAGAEAGQNDSTAASSSSSSNLPARTCVSQLMSVQRSLAALRAAERKETGGELQMFGMSTAPVQELEEWRSRVGIEFHLLSDSSLRFTRALDLPTLSSPSPSSTSATSSTSSSSPHSAAALHPNVPVLQRLTLLLREGQVVGKDLLPSEVEAARAGERALRLLEPHAG